MTTLLSKTQTYLKDHEDYHASDSISPLLVYLTFRPMGKIDNQIVHLINKDEQEAADLLDKWRDRKREELSEKYRKGEIEAASKYDRKTVWQDAQWEKP
jgi:hypothetical protein